MPTFGAIRRNIERQTAATNGELAERFADLWIARLEEFEQRCPRSRLEQVQWLRTLAKITTKIDEPADGHEARAWRDLCHLCRRSMTALHRDHPHAAEAIREVVTATPILAPRFLSAHSIAERLSESLGPKLAVRREIQEIQTGPQKARRI